MDAVLLEWTSALVTGIDEIDEQHRELFRCAARVRDAAIAEDGSELDRTLAFLRDNVALHFRTEERYMAAQRYPDLARHREEHLAMLETFVEIAQEHLRHGCAERSRTSVDRFLSDWLRTHIGVTDLAMARFVRRARRA